MNKFFFVYDSVTDSIVNRPLPDSIPDEIVGYDDVDYNFAIDDVGSLLIVDNVGNYTCAPSRYSISPSFYENFISSALNFIFQSCLECGGCITINSNNGGICENCNALYKVESIKRKGKYEVEVMVTIKTPDQYKKYLCRLESAYRRIG